MKALIHFCNISGLDARVHMMVGLGIIHIMYFSFSNINQFHK